MFVHVIAASLLALTGTTGGQSSSGLVVLSPSASGALSMTGNSKIHIPSKVAYVNSSSNEAVKTVGTALLDVPQLFIVGKTAFGSNSTCTGTVTHSDVPYADPLATLKFPTTTGMSDKGAVSLKKGDTTLQPGYYSGGISLTGNGKVTFAPGVYVIGGSGLKITAGSIKGEGVTIIMQAGALDIGGTSSMELSPPTSGDTGGVVIAQPKSNTQAMSLAGGSTVKVLGSIYAPSALLTLVGNSVVEGEGPQLGDLVVANTVSLKGTGEIRIGGPGMPAITLPKAALYD